VPAETHSHQPPLDRDAVETVVREQLAEILEVDVDAVTLETRLREDLDADDFALLDLAEAVEAELGERSVGLTIDDEDLAEVHTVGDAVDILVARLSSRSTA
jgi:acyl carrier protein